MKTIEEKNRMIAEFMGKEWHKSFFKEVSIISVSNISYKFHTSWDWLMPVVEKIASIFGQLDYEDENRLKSEEIFYMDNMFSEFLQNDLKTIYGRCIEFIEWYNENK